MSRARPHLVGLVACGVGYTPHRDGATRRAVSTQLVGNPVCAHYRRHVTPGVCRREGTLRRGFPRPEPRLVGSQARNTSAKRRGLLEPEGFLLIAWLARARAVPQSHKYPCGSGGVRRRAVAGRTLRAAVDRSQRSVVWRRCPAADQRRAPAPCNFKGGSRGGVGTRRGVRVGSRAPVSVQCAGPGY